MRNALKLSAILLFALAAACGGQDAIDQSADFMAVTSGGAATTSTSSGDEFYIAIKKTELGQRYFLSAYLTQMFPGAVGYGAARSLGTRVVSFAVQNGKLFVFDTSDNHVDSSTFDPTILIDAYPIVTNATFNQKAGSENYVLFDPAAGLNKFGMLGDAYAAGSVPAQFNVDLSFLQRFRNIADGVTWEQVFSGFANMQINDGQAGEYNELRASGTLGLALRKYTEGSGFKPKDLPQTGEFYFRSEPKQVPGTGQFTQTATRWNIKKGMKPIKFVISDKIKSDPSYGTYDLYGALKAGVENWNSAFGFQVFSASLATSTQSYGDDDTNYILWDTDPSFGAAFADHRTNPNTGEIRGASVYFSSLWVLVADQIFSDDPAVRANLKITPVAKTPALVWDAMHADPLCTRFAPGSRPGDDERAIADSFIHALNANSSLTKKQKVEQYLTATLVHEMGHILGLRHNFKGSLSGLTTSTSVMDYLLDDNMPNLTMPQAYDIDAIKFLYDLSANEPAQAFCTDEDTVADPDCNQFDAGANPLTDYYAPLYQSVVTPFLAGTSNTIPNTTLNGVLQFARAGTAAEMSSAYGLSMAGLSAPLPAAQASNATYALRADFLARHVDARLYLDDPSVRGNFTNDPIAGAPFTSSVLAQLKGELVNVDGIRSFPTRRQSVDILKKLQSTAAYRVLLDSNTAISSTRSSMTGDVAAATDDLLMRIEIATSPYFY
ncbi:MAG: zinc-dependent metalloprotease [Deltaproteobacteria bacterium]|nr:zinc-dependent metalloprotease [Deltaproteobacteria bacterium]